MLCWWFSFGKQDKKKSEETINKDIESLKRKDNKPQQQKKKKKK